MKKRQWGGGGNEKARVILGLIYKLTLISAGGEK